MLAVAFSVLLAVTALLAGWLKCFSRGRPTLAGWTIVAVVVVLTTLSTKHTNREQRGLDRKLTVLTESQIDLIDNTAALEDELLAFRNEFRAEADTNQFTVNPEPAGSANDDPARYRDSLAVIPDLINQRHVDFTNSLLTLPPEEVRPALAQEPRSLVNAIVSDSYECRSLLRTTSTDGSGRRFLANLVEGQLAFVGSVTGDGAANLSLMAASDDWDLSRGFELGFDGREIQVDDDRCGNPNPGTCRVSVDLADLDAWETEFLTTLASSRLQQVKVIADPPRSVSLKPTAASRIQQAFRCIGAN